MSTSMTEEPFTIFHKFPPEVQLEILRQCSEGDLVCLSLTCRDMHYLAKPLLPEKPDLSKVDQLGSTPDMPQDYMDSNCICSNGNKGCKGARGRIVAYDPDTHRNRRHYYKKRYAACYECRAYPPEHPACMGEKRSEKLQITIGLREKACHMDIDGGGDGGRTMLIMKHINQMPGRG
ncbi:hypothetical protein FPSE_02421 [Fusarium pseudograminearum CS3096]|uniref:F-box domain-containing protein n=1 Tax=Fusarium pseudograminearum (strain CS3096) TaxID=1028729 RepID=K3VTG4_FUSPC|nr:hypothetical protein FPSE_02421 [Fusarium pseudograminearum CS3096]EKJ77343.1 hypothetical protein FPSE_02421 [Fusarium pseudograminearum CS3096]